MSYPVPITVGEALYPPEIALDYSTARHLLGQYEGWRARICAIGGVALFVPFGATPPALLALSVWVARGGIGAYGVGLLSLVTTSLPAWAYRRRVWERPVRSCLARRTAYDPRVAQVSVNVADADLQAAWTVIRRAGLIAVYSRSRGDLDALPLNVNISVARPISLPHTDDYAARDAVCEVFRATKIRVNVGGVEINIPHRNRADDTRTSSEAEGGRQVRPPVIGSSRVSRNRLLRGSVVVGRLHVRCGSADTAWELVDERQQALHERENLLGVLFGNGRDLVVRKVALILDVP